MNPTGFFELKYASPVPSSVRVRDEKSAMALDGFDLKSFRDNVKFSKPFTFAATRGAASRSAADAASVCFVFISLYPFCFTKAF